MKLGRDAARQARADDGAGIASRPIDVLLVSFNTAHLLPRLQQTLERAVPQGMHLRLLAVDNASSDRSGQILLRLFHCDVFIQNRVNVGFGRANNQLMEHVRSEYVLLLNTDAFVAPETIATTVAYMDSHPRCGILGVRLTDEDGSLQPSRRSFPTPLTTFLRRTGLARRVRLRGAKYDHDEDHASVAECDWVPGCYYLVRRAVLDEVGCFDPRFFLYFEEVDHCRRTRAAGWSVTYLPSATAVHLGGASAGSVSTLTRDRQVSVLQVESELLYMRKHHGAPGLLLHLALELFGDLIMAAKDLARGRGLAATKGRVRVARLTWRLAWRTGFGTRPTR